MWRNEGFADYFSTLRIKRGRAILGEVVPERIFALRFLPSQHEILSADRIT
jgi:hypothetical protein